MKENNKKGKGLLLVLGVTVLVLIGFVVLNKFVNKNKPVDNISSSSSNSDITSHADNASTQKVNMELSNPIIANLVYPKYNSDRSGTSGEAYTWEYKKTAAENMTREYKMINASSIVEGAQLLEGHEYYVTASDMKKAFQKVFGPDVTYTDGIFNNVNCGMYYQYYQDKDIYTSGSEPCGSGKKYKQCCGK